MRATAKPFTSNSRLSEGDRQRRAVGRLQRVVRASGMETSCCYDASMMIPARFALITT
jgi:hypothetical protein